MAEAVKGTIWIRRLAGLEDAQKEVQEWKDKSYELNNRTFDAEQKLERIRQLEEEYLPKFMALNKAAPSDYSDWHLAKELWRLTKEFRERVKKEIEP